MKALKGLIAVVFCIFVLAACATEEDPTPNDQGTATTDEGEGKIEIDQLRVAFVPSRDPDEILTVTEPLKELLIEELLNLGYAVNNVVISVGTNYETVGTSLAAGSIDVAFISGGTYVLYDDGADVILTATRSGLNKDFDNAADWNDGLPTESTDEQVTSYRSLILAGPSEKGRGLAEIVNSGGELTWEDIDSARWSVMSSSSSAGYIYPTIWLRENFDGRGITELSQVIQSDSYTSSFARLAAEQADVMVVFADGRQENEEPWNTEFNREASIWDEMDVIGVTPPIYNDTISVSKSSDIMTDDLKAALQQAFINIGNTEEGQEVIAIYNHEGYQVAQSSDYDVEREAQRLIRELGE